MPISHSTKMTANEKLAVTSLSSIMSFRMIGLFMVLPVFSLYAHQLKGATPALIGLAMGIYGLAQALLQIPFGSLSDRFGRKPIIFIGLLIFILGSILAGMAHSITLMIIGRALQGAGAVGSTILALMADLTRETQRTKAMALAGISIGFSFSLAIFIGPLLTQWLSINQLFFVAAFCGLIGMIILYRLVPNPAIQSWHGDTEPEFKSFLNLLKHKELAKLNTGIFILHTVFTANFIVIPINLMQTGLSANQQWKVYLPALGCAFLLSLACIGYSERKQKVKPFFISGIAALLGAELILWTSPNRFIIELALGLFFTGFSLLEAFLPSLISRTAPAARKGSAMGIYSCSQFLGIFIGGVAGGWLYGQYHFSGVYVFCIALVAFWLALAYLMQTPRHLVTQIWRIPPTKKLTWHRIAEDLRIIPGVAEMTFIAKENTAYFKLERETLQNPDFISLKEQLQSES